MLYKCFMPTASQGGGLLHTVRESSLFLLIMAFICSKNEKEHNRNGPVNTKNLIAA